MRKFLWPFLVALVLSLISFFPQQVGVLAGNVGLYTGTINFMCTEGDQPLNKIIFQFEENIGNTLMVYHSPSGWNCIHHGDKIELRNNLLSPGTPLQLILSCKWYMWEGDYTFTSVGTTVDGETVSSQGIMAFPDMIALQILFHLTNPFVRVLTFGGTLVLFILLIQSSRATGEVSG